MALLPAYWFELIRLGDCFSAYPSTFESLNMRVVELRIEDWVFVGASPPAPTPPLSGDWPETPFGATVAPNPQLGGRLLLPLYLHKLCWVDFDFFRGGV